LAVPVITKQTTIDEIITALQHCGGLIPSGVIECSMYTAFSQNQKLGGAETMANLEAGSQTHFHLRFFVCGGSGGTWL